MEIRLISARSAILLDVLAIAIAEISYQALVMKTIAMVLSTPR
jgi:hypothetical protein